MEIHSDNKEKNGLMITLKKKKISGWDKWIQNLDSQRDPNFSYTIEDLDRIIHQLENNDFSSLDPDFVREKIDLNGQTSPPSSSKIRKSG